MFFVMQPSTPSAFSAKTHYWLMSDSSIFKVSSASCFPGSWASACTDVPEYSSLGTGTGISLCWTLYDSYLPISPACWGPSKWQHSHLVYPTTPPIFFVACKLADSSLHPLVKVINEDVKTELAPYGLLGYTTSDWLLIDSMLLISTLWIRQFSQFISSPLSLCTVMIWNHEIHTLTQAALCFANAI